MECFFKSGTVQNSAVLQGRPIYLTSKQDCACVHGEESFVCVCSQSWYVSLSLEKKVYPKISFVLSYLKHFFFAGIPFKLLCLEFFSCAGITL